MVAFVFVTISAVNVPTFERLQQRDPAQGIENSLRSIDSNWKSVTLLMELPKEAGNKQKEKGKEKDCSLDCKENLGGGGRSTLSFFKNLKKMP